MLGIRDIVVEESPTSQAKGDQDAIEVSQMPPEGTLRKMNLDGK